MKTPIQFTADCFVLFLRAPEARGVLSFPPYGPKASMETCRATTLILLDVLPLCVSETVVTCLVCVSSVNTQTFSVFYSTNRHFTGEQTMRSAPRLREQFPPSGHSFIYFHSFIVFASLSYFSLFCSFFVHLWLFCGPLWFSLDN